MRQNFSQCVCHVSGCDGQTAAVHKAVMQLADSEYARCDGDDNGVIDEYELAEFV